MEEMPADIEQGRQVEQEAQNEDGGIYPDKGAYLLGYILTASDPKMDVIYGDHVQVNDSTYLHGEIAVDTVWQNR